MDSPPDDGPCEVTITAPDREWLQAFVRQLVEDRLAAAAHVDNMHTTYRWAGAIHSVVEARATVHTCLRTIGALDSRLQLEHPFDTPCLVAIPMSAGSETYLSWIEESVL